MKMFGLSAIAMAAAAALFGPAEAQACSVIDLTAAGSSATVNGAIVQQLPSCPQGCEKDPFVRLSAGACSSTESGYNTDGRGWLFNLYDADSSHQYTHSITLDDVNTTTIDGVVYRQFLLAVNEPTGYTQRGCGRDAWTEDNSLISLDSASIYLGTGADNVALFPDTLGRLVWSMDGLCSDLTLKLDDLNEGKNKCDYVLSVPDALFAAKEDGRHQYVYLYSHFGDLCGASAQDGCEQWSTFQCQVVPLPPAAYSAMLTMGMLTLVGARRRIARAIRG